MLSTDPHASTAALLIPGNDLAAEFYQPFSQCLDGFGFSTKALSLPGIRRLHPLLEALEHELAFLQPRGILIGHSFGGLLALCLAARDPERVSSLVLLEPAIIPSPWLARRAAKKYRDEVVSSRRDEFSNWSGSFRRLHDPERYPRWAIEHYLAMRRETDPEIMCALLDDLPSLYPLPFARVTMPVLVLRGASSGMWVRFGVSRLQRRLPRATSNAIEGAAHWMINEQDHAIAAAIAAFVHSKP